ncbi:hypothetical protein AML71_09230 [Escherichia coli]|nr:hypothetical protein AML71_09230 [Escherichia coli]
MVVTTSDVVMCQMRHSDVQGVYRVYGLWMAENFQDQVSISNQIMSKFAPSMPHAVRSDVVKQARSTGQYGKANNSQEWVR